MESEGRSVEEDDAADVDSEGEPGWMTSPGVSSTFGPGSLCASGVSDAAIESRTGVGVAVETTGRALASEAE